MTTATTWPTIFPDLAPDPLRGAVADHDYAAALTRTAAEATAESQRRFHAIRTGELSELNGAVAEAFVAVVGEIDTQLADLTPVFESLAAIFDRHAAELTALRAEASAALARAATRWDEVHRTEAGRREASEALAAIDAQIRRLRAAVDAAAASGAASVGTAETQLDRAEYRRWVQAGEVRRWETDVEQAGVELAASRTDYTALADAEATLIQVTCTALGEIALGSLKDATGLRARLADLAGAAWGLLGDAADVAHGVMDGIVDLVAEGLAELGDLLQGLAAVATAVLGEIVEALAVAIGVILVVVAAIVIVVAVVAIVVAAVQLYLLISVFAGPLQPLVWVGAHKTFQFLRSLGTYDGDPAARGDLDGTYEATPIAPLAEFPAEEGGRAAILEALALIDDAKPDEFVLVEVASAASAAGAASSKYVVVLPGVADLSDPDLGLNPYDRSVRDTDQVALRSSTSTSMADNRYARMVAEALSLNGVPHGADVMIVGHSFGADTALDLAADPEFADVYHVTHVVAAGYFSGPQLGDVGGDTEVLVLQNALDVPVKAEQVGYDTIAGVYGYGDAVGSFLDGDLIGGFAELGGSLQHFSQAAVDLPRMTRVVGNPLWSTTWPGVSSPNPGQTVAVFLGGREGYGHDPSNYTDYLVGHHNVSIAGFEASVAAAGYAAPGDVYTIDVSIPSDPAGAVAP